MSWNQNLYSRQSNIGQQLQNNAPSFQGTNFALNTNQPGHGSFSNQQTQQLQSQQTRSTTFPDSRANINQQFLASSQTSQYPQYGTQTPQAVSNAANTSLLQSSLTPQQAQQLQQLLAMQLIQQNAQPSQSQQNAQPQAFMQSQYGSKQAASSNFQLQLVQQQQQQLQQQQQQQQQLQQQQLQQLQQQQLQQRMLQQPQQQKSQNIGSSQISMSVTPEQWMLMQQQQQLLLQQQQLQQNAGAQNKRQGPNSVSSMARNDRSRDPPRPKDRETFLPFRGGRRRSPPPGSNLGSIGRQRRSPLRRSPPRERDRSPRRGRDSQREKRHRSKSHSRSPSRTPSRSRSPPRYREKEFLHRKDREHSEERDRDRKYIMYEYASGNSFDDFSSMSSYSFVEQDRDYENTKRRYSRLHIQDDFSKTVACWTQTLPFDKQRNILHYLPIYCQFIPTKADDKHSSGVTEEEDTTYLGVKYTAAVALTSGAHAKPGSHLSAQIKFLVAKQDRSDLMLIGGPWSKSFDGGNPADSSDALIKTAIRWTQHYANLDLSACSKWTRFMEIHYKRPVDATNVFAGFVTEVVVVFLADISEMTPNPDQFLEEWTKNRQKRSEKLDIQNVPEQDANTNNLKPELDLNTAPEESVIQTESLEQPAATQSTDTTIQLHDTNAMNLNEQKQEPQHEPETSKERTDKDEKEVPKVPGLIVTSWKPECVLISLAGLLDYNLSDKNEKTFEVSLFAEMFHEMLQRDFGNLILQAILDYREPSAKKRKRDSDQPISPSPTFSSPSSAQQASDTESQMETKKPKTEPGQEELVVKEEHVNQEEIKLEESSESSMQPEELTAKDPQELASPLIQPKKEKKPEIVVDEALTRAFQYFDRNLTGYMSTDDLEIMLHSLGYCFSKHYVHQLALKVVDPQIFKRVYYKKLTDKEVEPPDQIFS